jgi:hypothetical protein
MSGVHWVTEPNAYLEPKIGKSGYAAMPPKTVIQVFQDTVRKHGGENAMAVKVKVNVRIYTWEESDSSRIVTVLFILLPGNSFSGLEVLDLAPVLGREHDVRKDSCQIESSQLQDCKYPGL